MAQFYNCIDGEMLDEICEAYYGSTRGTVETVLSHANNRDLAKKLPVLSAGDVVYLPTINAAQPVATVSRLWD